jgi:hypothetical protein
MKKPELIWGADYLEFQKYEFRLGYFAQNTRLPASEIQEAWLHTHPPGLVLHSGEIIFISASEKETLLNWLNALKIPIVARLDIWECFCNPCVDTHYSEADALRDQKKLQAAGFSIAEIESIRAKITPALLSYNALIWDWCYLGLYDLLKSRSLVWPFKLTPPFYKWAMEIAGKIL